MQSGVWRSYQQRFWVPPQQHSFSVMLMQASIMHTLTRVTEHRSRQTTAQAWTRVNPTVYACVRALCADPSTTVVIFSGSDKAKLEETFGELDLWLAAENGIFIRGPPDANGTAPVRLVLSQLRRPCSCPHGAMTAPIATHGVWIVMCLCMCMCQRSCSSR